jgi:hypothetical protein
MDNTDLKSRWDNAHFSSQDVIYDKVSVEKAINMNHCKTISKILSDVKLKILISTMILVIYIGLMVYAFVYLDLDLSVYSLVPLTLAGFFILTITSSEIIRLLVLVKSADNMSVKESLLFIRKKLDRIRTIDFLFYLVFLYLFAALIVYGYLTEIGGVENLSSDNEILPLSLLGIVILLLLLIPWFIKYQYIRRYKKVYLSLNESARILNGDA